MGKETQAVQIRFSELEEGFILLWGKEGVGWKIEPASNLKKKRNCQVSRTFVVASSMAGNYLLRRPQHL